MQSVKALPGDFAHRPLPTTKQSCDSELLDRIADNDKLAMRVLFARHSVRAHRFVQRIVGDGALAEDIVSEVFVEVWRSAGRFDGNSKVSTWILGIARFRA